MLRTRNAFIQGWNTTARSGSAISRSHNFCFTRGLTCCFVRGCRIFYLGWGRTGCTASRNQQYETQSKRRGDLRQHARLESIGGRPPGHVCGFRPDQERPIADVGGGKQGDQAFQRSTKMPSTPRGNITRDHRRISIWDHRSLGAWDT